mmetsp:Transcript_24671/g.40629  ORF Transcript_24671/g.40629 Transcript_24671/m.40629 type:complete len:214 (-) Transcript_24671:8-649(-)
MCGVNGRPEVPLVSDSCEIAVPRGLPTGRRRLSEGLAVGRGDRLGVAEEFGVGSDENGDFSARVGVRGKVPFVLAVAFSVADETPSDFFVGRDRFLNMDGRLAFSGSSLIAKVVICERSGTATVLECDCAEEFDLESAFGVLGVGPGDPRGGNSDPPGERSWTAASPSSIIEFKPGPLFPAAADGCWVCSWPAGAIVIGSGCFAFAIFVFPRR